MSWNAFNLIDRNRIENGKVPNNECINCAVVGREYNTLKKECERLFKENRKLNSIASTLFDTAYHAPESDSKMDALSEYRKLKEVAK